MSKVTVLIEKIKTDTVSTVVGDDLQEKAKKEMKPATVIWNMFSRPYKFSYADLEQMLKELYADK